MIPLLKSPRYALSPNEGVCFPSRPLARTEYRLVLSRSCPAVGIMAYIDLKPTNQPCYFILQNFSKLLESRQDLLY
jgi:hypothetical protein